MRGGGLRRNGVVALAGVLCLAAAGLAQRDEPTRLVRGQVLDANGKPAAGAVVHLKNTSDKKQLSVTTDKDGRYQFNDVAQQADFKIWAEHAGKKSRRRGVSQFDTRPRVFVNLRLQAAKDSKSKDKKEKDKKKDEAEKEG